MSAASAPVTAPEARRLAANLFVVGFPLMLMEAVRRAHPIAARRFLRLPPDADRFSAGLAEPDPWVVQSSAAIDLKDGPAHLRIPDMGPRRFLITFLDCEGCPFASVGSRTRAYTSADLVLAGPHWHGTIKRKYRAVRCPSDFVWAVGRIRANSAADIAAVQALASRQSTLPLGEAPDAELRETPERLQPPDLPFAQQLVNTPADLYLHRLPALLERAPLRARARIAPLVSGSLAALGWRGADGGWDDEDLRTAVERGFADGMAEIVAAAAEADPPDDCGWSGFDATDDAEGPPLARAARMYATLGAPMRKDLLTLGCREDETGRPLSGEERYRVLFPPGALPPCEEAWSLALVAADPHESDQGGRSVLSSNGGQLALNRDGSLELIIQAETPQGDRPANWLEPPAGGFSLAMRLACPRPAALNGAWRMPPVERLGSRFARGAGGRLLRRAARALPAKTSALPLEDQVMKVRLLAAALAAGVTLSGPPALAQSADVDAEAVAALKRMSTYLGTLTSFTIKADSTLDVVLQDGQKVQVDAVTNYKVRRPNGFVIETSTASRSRRYVYDGKTFTAFAPSLGVYAQAEAPPTIRATLEKIDEKFGISLPLEDLFYWAEPSSDPEKQLQSAFYVGPAIVDGVKTRQYAFRQGQRDWQLWIDDGDRPLPRKLVIVTREDEARPAYAARLTWDTAVQLAADTFTFRPDKDAVPIMMAEAK